MIEHLVRDAPGGIAHVNCVPQIPLRLAIFLGASV